MPWCEDCAKFWTPSSMTPEGACPTCGRVLAVPAEPVAGEAAGDDASPPVGKTITVKDIRRMAAGDDGDEEPTGAPWHFKLMIAALAIYLGFRAVQLVLLVFR